MYASAFAAAGRGTEARLRRREDRRAWVSFGWKGSGWASVLAAGDGGISHEAWRRISVSGRWERSAKAVIHGFGGGDVEARSAGDRELKMWVSGVKWPNWMRRYTGRPFGRFGLRNRSRADIAAGSVA